MSRLRVAVAAVLVVGLFAGRYLLGGVPLVFELCGGFVCGLVVGERNRMIVLLVGFEFLLLMGMLFGAVLQSADEVVVSVGLSVMGMVVFFFSGFLGLYVSKRVGIDARSGGEEERMWV